MILSVLFCFVLLCRGTGGSGVAAQLLWTGGEDQDVQRTGEIRLFIDDTKIVLPGPRLWLFARMYRASLLW